MGYGSRDTVGRDGDGEVDGEIGRDTVEQSFSPTDRPEREKRERMRRTTAPLPPNFQEWRESQLFSVKGRCAYFVDGENPLLGFSYSGLACCAR